MIRFIRNFIAILMISLTLVANSNPEPRHETRKLEECYDSGYMSGEKDGPVMIVLVGILVGLAAAGGTILGYAYCQNR